MRKPRDYDAELKALSDRAKSLRERKLVQLGELVIATGADAHSPEVLAGALLGAAEMTDPANKEAWRKRGAAFFQRSERKTRGGTPPKSGGASANGRAPQSPAGSGRA